MNMIIDEFFILEFGIKMGRCYICRRRLAKILCLKQRETPKPLEREESSILEVPRSPQGYYICRKKDPETIRLGLFDTTNKGMALIPTHF